MNKIEIKKDIVYSGKAKKDITIIHLADIHFSKLTNDKKLSQIQEEIHKNNPDYVMITGDVLDDTSIIKDKTKIKQLLIFLTGMANYTKVIISLGNHDIFKNDDYKFFKNLNDLKNIYVLNNDIYVDENIYVSGVTLPNNYYYNINNDESVEILIEHLKKHKKLITNLPQSIPKVSLIHSPIKLTNKEVLTILKDYDLILCGHTHNGMIPKIMDKLFKKNTGIISPNKKMFPDIARGKIEQNIFGKKITIIITGGITKLSQRAGKVFSQFNFVYNIDINKVIITKRKGKYYE